MTLKEGKSKDIIQSSSSLSKFDGGDDNLNIIAEIVVGTYQEFILGYQLLQKSSDQDKEQFTLKPSFTNHSHCGSIRAVTTIGKHIVSGSTDEVVRIFNLSTRAEHGTLQQQNGTISCLASYDSTHLFSGSEDGTICVWRSGNWQCEKTLKGHQSGVVGITIHPTGKLALSIAKDKSLRTWNLVKGRCGYITNLKAVADVVQWSPEGTLYAIGISNRVDIYAVESAQVIYSIPFGKRITSICFKSEKIILVAGDKEEVEVHNIVKSKKLISFSAHKNRIKDMKFINHPRILVTVSNDGFIKLWDFRGKNVFSTSPSILTQVDTSCRITCVTAWSPDLESETAGDLPSPLQAKKLKRKKEEPVAKMPDKKIKTVDSKEHIKQPKTLKKVKR